ncbi:hypothetical protein MNB_SUP05-SYMBIONT-5-1355 [hydrothermal vent metagenome]|uniref:Uncharacterized protein n=1 Tax=hydrothermal vent metagenome TaxID=652676 RepID=A0A1W1E1G0_9ZZZZ
MFDAVWLRQVPNSFSAKQSLAANAQPQRPLKIRWEKGQV